MKLWSGNFVRLLVALAVLQAGAAAVTIAIPLVYFERFGFGTDVSVAFGIRVVAGIVAAPVAARLTVGRDPRRVVIISTVLASVFTAALPMVNSVGAMHTLVALGGFTSTFAIPALFSMRSMVIPRDHVVKGNSAIVVVERVAMFAGPALAALVLIFADVAVLFYAEAAAALLAALPIALSRLNLPPGGVDDVGGDGAVAGRDRTAFREAFRNPLSRAYLLTGLAYTVAMGLTKVVLLSIATSSEHVDELYGALLATIALGAVVGGVFGGRIQQSKLGKIYVIANVAEAVLWIAVVDILPLAALVAVLLGIGVMEAVATTAFFAHVQLTLDDTDLGVLFAYYIPLVNAAFALGAGMAVLTVNTVGNFGSVVLIAVLIAIPVLLCARVLMNPVMVPAAGVDA